MGKKKKGKNGKNGAKSQPTKKQQTAADTSAPEDSTVSAALVQTIVSKSLLSHMAIQSTLESKSIEDGALFEHQKKLKSTLSAFLKYLQKEGVLQAFSTKKIDLDKFFSSLKEKNPAQEAIIADIDFLVTILVNLHRYIHLNKLRGFLGGVKRTIQALKKKAERIREPLIKNFTDALFVAFNEYEENLKIFIENIDNPEVTYSLPRFSPFNPEMLSWVADDQSVLALPALEISGKESRYPSVSKESLLESLEKSNGKAHFLVWKQDAHSDVQRAQQSTTLILAEEENNPENVDSLIHTIVRQSLRVLAKEGPKLWLKTVKEYQKATLGDKTEQQVEFICNLLTDVLTNVYGFINYEQLEDFKLIFQQFIDEYLTKIEGSLRREKNDPRVILTYCNVLNVLKKVSRHLSCDGQGNIQLIIGKKYLDGLASGDSNATVEAFEFNGRVYLPLTSRNAESILKNSDVAKLSPLGFFNWKREPLGPILDPKRDDIIAQTINVEEAARHALSSGVQHWRAYVEYCWNQTESLSLNQRANFIFELLLDSMEVVYLFLEPDQLSSFKQELFGLLEKVLKKLNEEKVRKKLTGQELKNFSYFYQGISEILQHVHKLSLEENSVIPMIFNKKSLELNKEDVNTMFSFNDKCYLLPTQSERTRLLVEMDGVSDLVCCVSHRYPISEECRSIIDSYNTFFDESSKNNVSEDKLRDFMNTTFRYLVSVGNELETSAEAICCEGRMAALMPLLFPFQEALFSEMKLMEEMATKLYERYSNIKWKHEKYSDLATLEKFQEQVQGFGRIKEKVEDLAKRGRLCWDTELAACQDDEACKDFFITQQDAIEKYFADQITIASQTEEIDEELESAKTALLKMKALAQARLLKLFNSTAPVKSTQPSSSGRDGYERRLQLANQLIDALRDSVDRWRQSIELLFAEFELNKEEDSSAVMLNVLLSSLAGAPLVLNYENFNVFKEKFKELAEKFLKQYSNFGMACSTLRHVQGIVDEILTKHNGGGLQFFIDPMQVDLLGSNVQRLSYGPVVGNVSYGLDLNQIREIQESHNAFQLYTLRAIYEIIPTASSDGSVQIRFFMNYLIDLQQTGEFPGFIMPIASFEGRHYAPKSKSAFMNAYSQAGKNKQVSIVVNCYLAQQPAQATKESDISTQKTAKLIQKIMQLFLFSQDSAPDELFNLLNSAWPSESDGENFKQSLEGLLTAAEMIVGYLNGLDRESQVSDPNHSKFKNKMNKLFSIFSRKLGKQKKSPIFDEIIQRFSKIKDRLSDKVEQAVQKLDAESNGSSGRGVIVRENDGACHRVPSKEYDSDDSSARVVEKKKTHSSGSKISANHTVTTKPLSKKRQKEAQKKKDKEGRELAKQLEENEQKLLLKRCRARLTKFQNRLEKLKIDKELRVLKKGIDALLRDINKITNEEDHKNLEDNYAELLRNYQEKLAKREEEKERESGVADRSEELGVLIAQLDLTADNFLFITRSVRQWFVDASSEQVAKCNRSKSVTMLIELVTTQVFAYPAEILLLAKKLFELFSAKEDKKDFNRLRAKIRKSLEGSLSTENRDLFIQLLLEVEITCINSELDKNLSDDEFEKLKSRVDQLSEDIKRFSAEDKKTQLSKPLKTLRNRCKKQSRKRREIRNKERNQKLRTLIGQLNLDAENFPSTVQAIRHCFVDVENEQFHVCSNRESVTALIDLIDAEIQQHPTVISLLVKKLFELFSAKSNKKKIQLLYHKVEECLKYAKKIDQTPFEALLRKYKGLLPIKFPIDASFFAATIKKLDGAMMGDFSEDGEILAESVESAVEELASSFQALLPWLRKQDASDELSDYVGQMVRAMAILFEECSSAKTFQHFSEKIEIPSSTKVSGFSAVYMRRTRVNMFLFPLEKQVGNFCDQAVELNAALTATLGAKP